jgi:hypothetical protein
MSSQIIWKLTMYADEVFFELESPVSEAGDDAFERFEDVRDILLPIFFGVGS